MDVMHRHYSDLEERFQTVCRRLGVSPFTFGRVDGYRLWGAHIPDSPIANQTKHRPAMLAIAGLHGDEIAGVEGLLQWLEALQDKESPAAALTVVPCLNPYGYEYDVRTDAQGRDPNRHFEPNGGQVASSIRNLLSGRRYDLAVNLHEDWEMDGFYLYELKESAPFYGEAAATRIQRLGKLSTNEYVDEFKHATKDGVVKVSCKPEVTCGLPNPLLCRLLFRRYADHVFCTETPMRLPLSIRIQMQVSILDFARKLVTANSSFLGDG